MPASALACVLVLPSRYLATFVWLSKDYFPTWVNATPIGRYVRWQLGWGLTDLQAVGLVMVGLAGIVAWSRGTIWGSLVGFRRLLVVHARPSGRRPGHVVRRHRIARRVGLRPSPAVALARLGARRGRCLLRTTSRCRSASGLSPPPSSWPSDRSPPRRCDTRRPRRRTTRLKPISTRDGHDEAATSPRHPSPDRFVTRCPPESCRRPEIPSGNSLR